MNLSTTANGFNKKSVIGVDVYNLSLTGDKTFTITSGASDPNHIPSVIIRRKKNKMRDLKDLTNEEKKEIVDAVTKLLQTFYNLKVTEERLNSVSNMASNILKMTLDKNLIASVLSAHAERYNVAQEEFFKMFGMGSDNTAFWEYSKLVDKERQAEASIPNPETAANDGKGGEPNGNGGTKE